MNLSPKEWIREDVEILGTKYKEAPASPPFIFGKNKVYLDINHVVAESKQAVTDKITMMIEAIKNHGAEPVVYLTQSPVADDGTHLWLASLYLFGKMSSDSYVKWVKWDSDRGCVPLHTSTI